MNLPKIRDSIILCDHHAHDDVMRGLSNGLLLVACSPSVSRVGLRVESCELVCTFTR